jgi:hypothetical protein
VPTGDFSFTDDLSPGAWIEPLLGGEFGAVTLQVPDCFPAYARICHPALGDAGEPVDWPTVAKATGRTPHALMQWHALVGSPDPFNFTGSLWAGHDPQRGSLDAGQLRSLCDLLAAHTTDATHCFAGVWAGWGSIDAPASHPELRLPGREYHLLEGPLAAASEVGHDRWPAPQSPNLLWPKDRAWFVASEIDFDSTLVGGTNELIETILKQPTLDAWPVSPTDSLAHDADKVNQIPPWNPPRFTSPPVKRSLMGDLKPARQCREGRP